jgi:hypothetical protein
MSNGIPQLSFIEVHRDAIKAANGSWSETDKLYVSVCSALIALAAIFGWGKGPPISLLIVGLLLVFLAVNWALLIKRYRCIILYSLRALSEGQIGDDIKEYFKHELARFKKD